MKVRSKESKEQHNLRCNEQEEAELKPPSHFECMMISFTEDISSPNGDDEDETERTKDQPHTSIAKAMEPANSRDHHKECGSRCSQWPWTNGN